MFDKLHGALSWLRPGKRQRLEVAAADKEEAAAGAEVDSVSAFDSLPDDIVRRIFLDLGLIDCWSCQLGLVSTRFRRLLFTTLWPEIEVVVPIAGHSRSVGPQAPKKNAESPGVGDAAPAEEEAAGAGAGAAPPGAVQKLRRIMIWMLRISGRQVLLAPGGELRVRLEGGDVDPLDGELAGRVSAVQESFARDLASACVGVPPLLAAAACAFGSSLATVSLALDGTFFPVLAERGAGPAAPPPDALFLHAALALAPAAGLRALHLDAHYSFGALPRYLAASAAPAALHRALAPHAATLRELHLPGHFLLTAAHADAVAAAAPGLEQLTLSLAPDALPAALQTLAALPLTFLSLLAPRAAPLAPAAFAALPASPCGAALRVLRVASAGALCGEALEALGRLRVEELAVTVDLAGAPAARHLAGLPLRSLYLVLGLPEGGSAPDAAALCRALAAPLARLAGERAGLALELEVGSADGVEHGRFASPAAARPFDSPALARLLEAARPALTALSYDVFVEEAPCELELRALAACPRLESAAWRHRAAELADLTPYSLLTREGRGEAGGRRVAVGAGVRLAVDVAVPRGRPELEALAVGVLAAWLAGTAELATWAY